LASIHPEDDKKSTEGKLPVLAGSQFAACRTEYLNDYYWFLKPASSRPIDVLHYYLSVFISIINKTHIQHLFLLDFSQQLMGSTAKLRT